MKTKSLLVFLVIFFVPFMAFGQGDSNLSVEDIQICTSVEDRQPIGADTSFTSDIGQLYCFTSLKGDQDNTIIYHAWYYDDQEMTKVELGVRAKTWRTWSSKRILNSWTGNWRVDVLSSNGSVLASIEFTVR